MNNVDLILYNGKVISGDARGHTYEAIAISGDKILELGTTEYILALRNKLTELINLEGKVVIPGLIDSHTHILQASLSELKEELFIASSVGELLDHIKEKVKTTGKGEWLYFPNTYPTRLDEYRYPSIEELDEVAPNNPVFIDGAYAGQTNSCALRTAGIDEKTIPPYGEICKDGKTGKLNGRFFLCTDLIKKHIETPQYEKHEMLDSVERLLIEYAKLGVTSVIDAATSVEAVEIFNELYRNKRLNMRITYNFVAGALGDIKKEAKKFSSAVSTPPEWGKPGFLKIFLDGGILTGTAFMRKPYGKGNSVFGIDNPDFCGIIMFEKEELVEYILKACELGLQMTAHCIGDGAVDRFVSAYEEADKIIPVNGRRFSIIHADFTDAKTLERIKKLGLILISQPAWHYKDGTILNKIFDTETMSSFLPYRNIEAADVHICAGSDHMVKHDSFLSQNPYNPYLGIYNLVTRKTRSGDIIYPDQKVSRKRALEMYTINGAYASFDENMKGSLEPGKFADMAVLSRDLFACNEEEIPLIESELTIVGGKIVYRNVM